MTSLPSSDRRGARLARFWIAYENRDVSPALWRAPFITDEEWRVDLFKADAGWDVRGPFVPEPAPVDGQQDEPFGGVPFSFDRAWVWRRRDDGETGVRFTDPANDGVMAGFASEYVEVVPASERDRVHRLAGEVERLREAEKLALQLKDEAERCVKDLLAENDRLAGEVERLREALREIAEAEGFERTDASDEIGETT